MARYVITNTRRMVLILVNFQNDYYSVSYWIKVSILSVAIWNVTAKRVTLITGDPQMSREGY